MNSISRQITEPPSLDCWPRISFEDVSDTLILDDIEIHLDLQLGDDDLEVSLLIESLEQQYKAMDSEADEEAFLSLQNAKEWVNNNRDRFSGLFRYLKSLSVE